MHAPHQLLNINTQKKKKVMASKSYDELHGSNNWDGLLDPLDNNLRSLILRYGDLASAAQRAFNVEKNSKYAGYCHYGKSSFFNGVMLPWADSNYHVAYYIYATSDTQLIHLPLIPTDGTLLESSWMGFVAVSNDDYSNSIGSREICVVWRGTEGDYQLKDDLFALPVKAEPLIFPPGNGADIAKVMDGWLRIYNSQDPNSKFLKTSARTQLFGRIKELLAKYKNEKVSIICTGHSLGASLALLSAVDLAVNVATSDVNVSSFAFGCPQVGNEAFRAKMEELVNLKVLTVRHEQDIVPLWPSKLLKQVTDITWLLEPSGVLGYVDVGIPMVIDGTKSPYFKDEIKSNPMVFHDLQGILHTLGGWNGENGDFDLNLGKRDLSLANIKSDLLKDEFQIPGSWWVEKNKGMVIDKDGHWVLSPIDPDDHDLPSLVQ